jgi:hypothetical protein
MTMPIYDSFLNLYPRLRDTAFARLMAQDPFNYGDVAGVTFLEHPELGDEVGFLALYEGKLYQTDWYDLPRECDILDD